MSFDTYYPDHPWGGINTNQREFYDPVLRDIYYSSALYNRFVTQQFDLYGKPAADSMSITSLRLPEGNFDPVDNRMMWAPSSRIDTFRRTIGFQHYIGKMAYTKHDEAITYWKGNPYAGLARIAGAGIGRMMTTTMDRLARNAFLDGAYKTYGNSPSSANFEALDSSEVLTTSVVRDIHLGMSERGVPYADQPNGVAGNIVCLTSYNAIASLQSEASSGGNANAFIDVMKYADPSRIIRGEVGTYHGVRFVASRAAILYNVGTQTGGYQKTIAAAAQGGDGAPNPATTTVDGVRREGQTSGVTYYLQLNNVTSMAVGDYISVHIDRTSDFGVSNGPDYRDGTKREYRVISIDSGNNRITIDKPLELDYATDLGGGVYGYVTKGRHVHSALFIGGNDGVVQGINVPPRIYVKNPVDDVDMVWRVSWDAYMGYKVFEPQNFEVWLGAARNRPGTAAATD